MCGPELFLRTIVKGAMVGGCNKDQQSVPIYVRPDFVGKEGIFHSSYACVDGCMRLAEAGKEIESEGAGNVFWNGVWTVGLIA
jgi:hypothetical protein